MLSRTASCLYWLGRYVERMSYVARLLEVAQRMSAMTSSSAMTEWRSALIASGGEPEFLERHTTIDAAAIIDFLGRNKSYSSSIIASMEAARHNARTVRGAITVDMWDAINGTWLEARSLSDRDFSRGYLSQTLDWFKMRAILFNGAHSNTMLRSDAFYFVSLGTYIERVDNTSRILDVKYNVLLPSYEQVGGGLDYGQWTAILRAVSAQRAYHFLYKDRVKPWNVAELMLLRRETPRSLRACYDEITSNLDLLNDHYQSRGGECHRLAGELHARLRYGRIEDIFQGGLHEFLTEYIDRTIDLGGEIENFYFN
ncbi:MAG: alpha-E domain-containing protein [Pseudomonadota bacterium]